MVTCLGSLGLRGLHRIFCLEHVMDNQKKRAHNPFFSLLGFFLIEPLFLSCWSLLHLISDPRVSGALGLFSSRGCPFGHGSCSWEVMLRFLWVKAVYDRIIVGMEISASQLGRYSVYVQHLLNMGGTQSVVLQCWSRILEAFSGPGFNLLCNGVCM